MSKTAKLTLITVLVTIYAVSFYLAFLADNVHAATGINKTINFQGKVVNADGTNVADGNYDFEFNIYTAASGGSPVWTETWDSGTAQVSVTDGIFRVSLGTHTAFPGSVDFNTDNIYLGITFNNDADGEMTPRVRFTAVPYAFNAEKVAGLTVTNTTGTLTIPNSKTIQFADSFTTSGTNPLTLTTTSTTDVTLPTSGTLATLAGTETLTNKSLTDTLNAFTDDGDATKLLKFDVANVGTGTTLTLALPSSPGTSDTICLQTKANCGGSVTVGSMTGSSVFSSSSADDDWLGLGATAGRIEFDDQITDEINFISANVGIGTQTPSSPLHVIGTVTLGNSGNSSIGSIEQLDDSFGSSFMRFNSNASNGGVSFEFRDGGNAVLRLYDSSEKTLSVYGLRTEGAIEIDWFDQNENSTYLELKSEYATNQATALTGAVIDLSTNWTVPNSSSGNQTGIALTMANGGASATSVGLSIAGAYDTGISFTGTPGTNLIDSSTIDISSTGAISGSTGYSQSSGTFSLTAADGSLINLSAINVSGTGEGLILPQNASCASATANGQVCWDNDTYALYVGDGTTANEISGGGGGTVTESGTNAAGQISYFTADQDITSSADFTFSGGTLSVSNGANAASPFIAKDNGTAIFTIADVTGTAANGLTFTGSASGSAPTLAATGSDTNIGLSIASKGTGTLSFSSAATTGTTTSSAFNFAANSLTSGTGLYLASTNVSFSTGKIANIEYNPSSTPSTAPTGDLLRLSLGSNATNFAGNYLNILNSGGSSIFSVSDTAVTTSLPTNFSASGDVAIAYDLNFTNPTASYIKSAAPLYLVAGETFNSSDLTLQTYNYGSIVLETSSNGAILMPNGNVGIGTGAPTSFKLQIAGSIGPNTNDTYDLGSDANRWKDLYLGGDTIHIGTSSTDEGTISYNTTTNVFHFGSDSTTNADIAFFSDDLYLDKSTGRVGIGDTSPDALLDLDTSSTTVGAIGINQTGSYTGTGTSSVFQISTAATMGEAFYLSATSLTSGSAMVLEGPSTATLTDDFIKITTDVGAATGTNAALAIRPDFSSTAGVSAYGLLVDGTDSVSAGTGNTSYGIASKIALSNDPTTNNKLAIGISSTVSTSSTKADTTYGLNTVLTATGAMTTGTRTQFGVVSQPTSTANSSGGTLTQYGAFLNPSSTLGSVNGSSTLSNNQFGAYVSMTGTFDNDCAANCGLNQYGLYVANGSSSTNGTTGKYGLYLESMTGADVNYQIYSAGSANSYFGGNIGIGTIPSGRLDILATGDDTSPVIKLRQSNASAYGIDLGIDNNVDGGLYVYTNNNGTQALAMSLRRDNGNLSIGGNTYTAAKLNVYNSGNNTAGFRVYSSNGNYATTYADASNNIYFQNSVGYLSVNASGNVVTSGSLTTNALSATSGTFSGNINASSGTLYIQNSTAANWSGQIINTNTTNGYGLLIRGGVSSTTWALGIMDAAASTWITTIDGSGNIGTTGSVTVNAGDFFDLNPTTTNAASPICRGTNGLIGSCPSDARLKENIEYMDTDDNALSKILALKPATFDFRNGGQKNQAGFIAQDLVNVIPESVTLNSDGYYSFNSTPIVGYMAKALQELNAKVENTLLTIGEDGQAVKKVNALTSRDESLVIKNQKGEKQIELDSNGNAKFTGIIKAKSIKADTVEGLEIFVDKLVSEKLEKSLNGLLVQESTASATTTPVESSKSGSIQEALVATNGIATESGTLNLDQLTVKESAIFAGIVQFMESISARMLVVTEFAEFLGKVIFKDNVEILGTLTVNNDAAGTAVIKPGATEVEITFEKEYETIPQVTASVNLDQSISEEDMVRLSPQELIEKENAQNLLEHELLNAEFNFIIARKSTKGFVIKLSKPIQTDLVFSWHAQQVKDSVIFTSKQADPKITPSSESSQEESQLPLEQKPLESEIQAPEQRVLSTTTKPTEIVIKDTETGFLRVRKEPKTSSEEIGQVSPGSNFTTVETTTGLGGMIWYKIEFEQEKSGWVKGEYVELVSDVSKDQLNKQPNNTPTATR